jgi:hypothetical protein
MEQHVKLAAIEFFRRTLSYRQVLDPVTTDGTALVPLDAPMQTQIIKIKSVSVGAPTSTRSVPSVCTASSTSRHDSVRRKNSMAANRTCCSMVGSGHPITWGNT